MIFFSIYAKFIIIWFRTFEKSNFFFIFINKYYVRYLKGDNSIKLNITYDEFVKNVSNNIWDYNKVKNYCGFKDKQDEEKEREEKEKENEKNNDNKSVAYHVMIILIIFDVILIIFLIAFRRQKRFWKYFVIAYCIYGFNY